MENQKTVCVVAGKSGGHLIPGLTWTQEFMRANPGYKVLFFSTDTQLDRSIVKKYPFIFSYVPLSMINVPRKQLLKYPLFLWQFTKAFFKSLRALIRLKPEKIVSMGGYISFPVCLAGWFLRIPIIVYELNAVPGMAVKWLSPLASTVSVCFTQAASFFPAKKVAVTQYPLRFTATDKRISKLHACKHLGLDVKRKTLLILGGSQGSRFLNDIALSFVQNHPQLYGNIQIIHQAGGKGLEAVKEAYTKCNVPALVFDYRHDIQFCYKAADIALARAGAGTLFELGFFNKKAVIVPLETGTTDHQRDNANAMSTQRPELFSVIHQKSLEQDLNDFYKILYASLSPIKTHDLEEDQGKAL